jgi:hypothetical protein
MTPRIVSNNQLTLQQMAVAGRTQASQRETVDLS